MGGEWKRAQLSDLAQITSGKRPKVVSKVLTADCKVPIYGGGGPSGFTSCSMYSAGVLVTGRVGTLGKLFAPREDFWPTDNTLVIIPKSPHVDHSFLRYSLEPAIPYLAAMNRGAANPLITQGDVGRLIVRLPPLPEQRAIAHILGTLDDKIELNRRMNETLETIAQAIFKSWFVNFDPVVVNAIKAGNPIPDKFAERAAHYRESPDSLGLPDHILRLFPDRFVDSDLGPIPEGWEVGIVSDLGNVVTGKTPSTKELSNYGDDISFITIPDMHDKIYVTETKKRLSIKGAETQKNKYIPPNSVCVSCIATPGLVILTAETAQTNQQINCVIPEKISPFYIYELLRNLDGQIRANGSGGSVFSNLSKSRFEALKVLIADTGFIASFHNYVRPLFKLIMSYQIQSSNLLALRDSLLPKLISGELRVPDAENIIERGYI